MERRYQVRLDELMGDAQVPAEELRGLVEALDRFLDPYVDALQRAEQRTHAHHYVAGLLSPLKAKNVESIASLHDEARVPLQKFVGQAPWDHRPLLDELAQQVGQALGETDAVLAIDPSAFAKKGHKSVGVQRQWCGRLGKVENCQVGVYLAYVSRQDHALVDEELYLPQEWAKDKQRRLEAGVPKEVRFRTRHELALAMLARTGTKRPHAWVTGDDEMGRSTSFRRDLRGLNERYLLAVPSNTRIRDLAATPPAPAKAGKGRAAATPFVRVDRWAAALPADAWTRLTVGAGERGPVVVEISTTRVLAYTEKKAKDNAEEVLVVLREPQADGSVKHDYYLSNAAPATPRPEFARAAKAEHRVEECFRRAKGNAGLADYEVRTWRGWHHHQTLSLIATWFLTQQAQRKKKGDPRTDGGYDGELDRAAAPAQARGQRPSDDWAHRDPQTPTQRASALLQVERV